MNKIVLIEKISSLNECWKNLIKRNRITQLSVEEVVNKYKGFEGELVFTSYIKEEFQLNKVVHESLKKEKDDFLLLYVNSLSETPPCFLKKYAVPMGYDVGVCEEEQTIYSSIFNEILFGIENDLISYKDSLNENLIFPNQFLAQKYINLHNNLSVQGRDVEDYEPLVIYEVWSIKS